MWIEWAYRHQLIYGVEWCNHMQEVPLMVRNSSGLHSHSLRLAKQDSINSLQTKLRQQFRQRMASAAVRCPAETCSHKSLLLCLHKQHTTL